MARKYKKVSCHGTKTAAKKKQGAMHKKGQTAQLRKNPDGGWCVFSAGKSKAAIKGTSTKRKKKK